MVLLSTATYLCSAFKLVDNTVSEREKTLEILKGFHDLQVYANEYFDHHLLIYALDVQKHNLLVDQQTTLENMLENLASMPKKIQAEEADGIEECSVTREYPDHDKTLDCPGVSRRTKAILTNLHSLRLTVSHSSSHGKVRGNNGKVQILVTPSTLLCSH